MGHHKEKAGRHNDAAFKVGKENEVAVEIAAEDTMPSQQTAEVHAATEGANVLTSGLSILNYIRMHPDNLRSRINRVSEAGRTASGEMARGLERAYKELRQSTKRSLQHLSAAIR